MTRKSTESRQHYLYWLNIPTRWQDGDPYGHVNNVVYYSFFDTVLTRMLIEFEVLRGPYWRAIGLCIESHCEFHSPVNFPEAINAGLRIGHIGNTSLRYEIGLFRENDTNPCASGYFVHVFVDPDSGQPQPLVAAVREKMESLMLTSAHTTPSVNVTRS